MKQAQEFFGELILSVPSHDSLNMVFWYNAYFRYKIHYIIGVNGKENITHNDDLTVLLTFICFKWFFLIYVRCERAIDPE